MPKAHKLAILARLRIDVRKLPKSTLVDAELHQNFSAMRESLREMRKFAKNFAAELDAVEGKDKLGNYEIQNLMNSINEAETLKDTVSKRLNCLAGSVISKIG